MEQTESTRPLRAEALPYLPLGRAFWSCFICRRTRSTFYRIPDGEPPVFSCLACCVARDLQRHLQALPEDSPVYQRVTAELVEIHSRLLEFHRTQGEDEWVRYLRWGTTPVGQEESDEQPRLWPGPLATVE